MPNPTQPLKRNIGKAAPRRPFPKRCDQTPSRTVATIIRQKFARMPPNTLVVRCAETAEIENKIVVNKAGNIGALLCLRAKRCQRILKGFQIKAQGCEERGLRRDRQTTPMGLEPYGW